MRSLILAVVVLAGILACTSAVPQFNRKQLAILETLLAEAGKINSTIRFGNNTIVASGIANAVANSNDGTIRPNPPQNQWGNNNNYNNYNNYRYPYYYGGYWRTVNTVNGEIVEDLDASQEGSYEESHELSDQESNEDSWSQEDETEEDDDEEDEEDIHQENADEQGDESQEDEADEGQDLYEEAADMELDLLEKELNEKDNN
ncbi:hypothetical protein KR074_011257 [Drosophila pseudoananassae]|nr:hypothetical protein KR074_011257 [Drosophila pseudoananassae]